MTNAEAWFNKSLRPRKPEGSLGRTAQYVHLDSHTAPELWLQAVVDRFYIALFSALGQTHCARMWLILHEWIAFYSAFFTILRSGALTALAWLVPHETAAISARSVYTIQPCTCHFMQNHILKVHAYLAVTCHPHFWQYDRGLLRAAAVTLAWNGYRNKSQHRKLTQEKKSLLLLLQVSGNLCLSRFHWAKRPWGLESEVTFAQDIPYEPVHGYY